MNYQTSAEQKVSFRYESIDSIFAILTVVVGFFFSKALPVEECEIFINKCTPNQIRNKKNRSFP